eukprot:8291790-Prorocentrum_lima.AAC.1
MATDIGGNTLHAALGLNTMNEHQQIMRAETAKRLGLLRWLVVDEISMVSAKLLGQVDARLSR